VNSAYREDIDRLPAIAVVAFQRLMPILGVKK
jgi:hypothetical protein